MTGRIIHPLEGSPGRIVLAGDWHGDLEHAQSVVGWAAEQGAQGVVQLGDFGIWPGSEGQRYLYLLNKTMTRHDMWLAFVDGNHEDFEQLYAIPLDHVGARRIRPRIWHLPRGLRWKWHDLTWLALGGATSLDRPSRRMLVDWWPEEELTMAQLVAAMEGGPADVMLTHDCPAGFDIPGLPPAHYFSAAEMRRANNHREFLLAAVDQIQPQHLWHGHFHVRHTYRLSKSRYTTLINGLNDNTGPWGENIQMLDLAGDQLICVPAQPEK